MPFLCGHSERLHILEVLRTIYINVLLIFFYLCASGYMHEKYKILSKKSWLWLFQRLCVQSCHNVITDTLARWLLLQPLLSHKGLLVLGSVFEDLMGQPKGPILVPLHTGPIFLQVIRTNRQILNHIPSSTSCKFLKPQSPVCDRSKFHFWNIGVITPILDKRKGWS